MVYRLLLLGRGVLAFPHLQSVVLVASFLRLSYSRAFSTICNAHLVANKWRDALRCWSFNYISVAFTPCYLFQFIDSFSVLAFSWPSVLIGLYFDGFF